MCHGCVCACSAGAGWIHWRGCQLLERGFWAAAQQAALLGLCKTLIFSILKTIFQIVVFLLFFLGSMWLNLPLEGNKASSNTLLSLNSCHVRCSKETFCVLRSCLHLCGVECFIPLEDSRPASLTGRFVLSKSCRVALTGDCKIYCRLVSRK